MQMNIFKWDFSVGNKTNESLSQNEAISSF